MIAPRPQDRPIELALHFHRESDAAVLVSLDGDEGKSAWLPKSKIIVTAKNGLGRSWLITLPLWLAKAKGLLADADARQQALF